MVGCRSYPQVSNIWSFDSSKLPYRTGKWHVELQPLTQYLNQ
uniref:Uncharacterized protein n=1 Tax=Arundo donax TaxID=35708 RepID=A0A0A9H678_ARUDO